MILIDVETWTTSVGDPKTSHLTPCDFSPYDISNFVSSCQEQPCYRCLPSTAKRSRDQMEQTIPQRFLVVFRSVARADAPEASWRRFERAAHRDRRGRAARQREALSSVGAGCEGGSLWGVFCLATDDG